MKTSECSGRTLAFLGDAVWSMYVRQSLIMNGQGKGSQLQKLSIAYVSAKAQAHIYEKRCPAGACSKLKVYTIDPELCKGCSKCARNCPVGAIHGEIKNPYEIDQSVCIKCGACVTNCSFGAVREEA